MAKFYSSFVTKAHTHTHQGLKEAPGRHSDAFVKARFPMSPCSSTQIDHRSAARCMKGKCMHVFREVQREGENGGESRKEEHLSFLSTLSPCLMSPSFLLPSCTPPLLSLSPQRNPVSPLGTKLFEGDPELRCSLPPLSSLPTTLPFSPPHLPSTFSAYPSAHRGPGFRSTQGNRAPNPSPGLTLLLQASQAGCPAAAQRQRGGRPGRGRAEGGMRG